MQTTINPNINRLPKNFRLPGEKWPERLGLPTIEGTARRVIAHALTWHGIPQKIDDLLARLPEEKRLEALNPLSRKYLAFTVLSLKQMVAAGTISPETAWTLFYGEWGGLGQERISHSNYSERRSTFYGTVRTTINSLSAPVDLLEFEFWARAGEAGMKQFKKFHPWAEKLVFVRKKFKQLGEELKDEYRKTLWLEMRMMESRLGLGKLNKDIGRMVLLRDGAYFYKKKRTIGMTVSLRSTEGIDSTLKAEMGHWMFELFAFKTPWIEELMDRMNMTGYSTMVNEGLAKSPEERSPEQNTFISGGYYLASRRVALDQVEADYPTYPEEFPQERIKSGERHEIAEKVEGLTRPSIIRAKKNKGKQALKQYGRTGFYAALLDLEGKTGETIVRKIEAQDGQEIKDYVKNYKAKAIPGLENLLSVKNVSIRKMAAKSLLYLTRPPKESPEYKRLANCQRTGQII